MIVFAVADFITLLTVIILLLYAIYVNETCLSFPVEQSDFLDDSAVSMADGAPDGGGWDVVSDGVVFHVVDFLTFGCGIEHLEDVDIGWNVEVIANG